MGEDSMMGPIYSKRNSRKEELLRVSQLLSHNKKDRTWCVIYNQWLFEEWSCPMIYRAL